MFSQRFPLVICYVVVQVLITLYKDADTLQTNRKETPKISDQNSGISKITQDTTTMAVKYVPSCSDDQLCSAEPKYIWTCFPNAVFSA